jgi:drug/metabolite transporter (DMT)-like permease
VEKKNATLGLFGVVGIWLTAGLALPFVNVLQMFTPEQLMVFRGFLTASIALLLMRGRIGKADKYTYLIAFVLPLATLGLFEGIRSWGAGPTITILTATPLINVVYGLRVGRRLSATAALSLLLVLGGVVLARWQGHFAWDGLGWSLFGTAMNGILYELFVRAKTEALQKCFWACLGTGILGLVLSTSSSWNQLAEPKIALAVLGFAFVGGFLYWIANLIAFGNLPTNEASILAQGETITVLLGAYLLLDEQITLLQGVGVALAIGGAGYLSIWLAKQPKHEKT